MPKRFSIYARIASFKHAFRGASLLIGQQHNARVHLFATVLVIAAGVTFSITSVEWMLLLLTIGGVWMGEALNTAVEYIADALHPEPHPLIKNAKDVAAAAVLVFALCAGLVGLLIFIPYLTL